MNTTAAGAFSAVSTFTRRYGTQRETADLAAWLDHVAARAAWELSVTSTSNYSPITPRNDTTAQRAVGALAADTALTGPQAWALMKAYLSAYNSRGSTDIEHFQRYRDADPAAWPDWLDCVKRLIAAKDQ